MEFKNLQFLKEGAIGFLTLSRPKALNALNAEMLEELDQFVETVKGDKSLRALIVTGDGEKSFVAGADIKEMVELDADAALLMARKGQRIFQKLEDLPFPTIAAVNGFALGGGMELALACDFIIASQKAKFGLPEVSLGLIPGYGGTQRLSRCVGRSVAKMVTFTGDLFTADQMCVWGAVAEVVAPESLKDRVVALARTMSERGPMALNYAKQAIALGFDKPLAEGLEAEARLFSKTFSTADHNEGIQAFIEKRAPQFEGV